MSWRLYRISKDCVIIDKSVFIIFVLFSIWAVFELEIALNTRNQAISKLEKATENMERIKKQYNDLIENSGIFDFISLDNQQQCFSLYRPQQKHIQKSAKQRK